MSLGLKQEKFQRLIVMHKLWMFIQGYQIRGGDAFRDPRVHGEIGEKMGYGHVNSVHKSKLAEDLYITSDGILLSTFDEHLIIGEHWEGLDPECRWGGRFGSVDCVHFSLEHNGYM
jgi:hypothetical protein